MTSRQMTVWKEPLIDSRSVAEKVGAVVGACCPLDTASSYLRCASFAMELEMSLADTAAPCRQSCRTQQQKREHRNAVTTGRASKP